MLSEEIDIKSLIFPPKIDNECNSIIRQCIIPPNKSKTVKTSTLKTKRIITQDIKKWIFPPEELTYESQNAIIVSMADTSGNIYNIGHTAFVSQQIRQKMYGYRAQDIMNGIFDINRFVKLTDIINKCRDCKLLCFYCHEPMLILYEFVRDPKQWTVERIDNDYGHNHDNFEIACLSCNCRRRTIHFERYLLTKRLRDIKKQM